MSRELPFQPGEISYAAWKFGETEFEDVRRHINPEFPPAVQTSEAETALSGIQSAKTQLVPHEQMLERLTRNGIMA